MSEFVPKPDPTAPDPGPRPEPVENMPSDEIIAKWGANLKDEVILKQLLDQMVYDKKLEIAGGRKRDEESKADEAWMAAYIKRYGTDEG